MAGTLRKLSLALTITSSPKSTPKKIKKRKTLPSYQSVYSFDMGLPSSVRNETNRIYGDNSFHASGATLLEKALNYREEHPDLWKEKQKEHERNRKESDGIYDEDPFLDSYYKRLDELIEEKHKIEERRRFENPKVVLRLIYNLPGTSGRRESNRKTTRTSSIISPEEKDFDVYKRDLYEVNKENLPELTISVVKGKYLLNKLCFDKEKYDTAKVKCKLVAAGSIYKQKHKSEDVYVNREGKTRWNHSYILKGFSEEQLKKSHVVLNVVGRNGETQDIIGEAVAAGDEATITVAGSDYLRGPTEEESSPWQQAIENPGTVVEVTRDLLYCNEAQINGRTIAPLQRMDLLLSHNKFRGKMRKAIRRKSFPSIRFMKTSF